MKGTTFFYYYSREIRTLLATLVLLSFFQYRAFIADNVLTEKGMMVLLGSAIGGVAGAVITVYYRVIVIKYTGKNNRN